MRVCPKCHRTVGDESRICRVCGSILDLVPDPPAAVEVRADDEAPADLYQDEERVSLSDLADSATNSVENDPRRWVCPNCREEVEHNFDICWNCGTDREGVRDLEFVTDEERREETDVEKNTDKSAPATRPCIRCGSERVIPGAEICDQGQGSDGNLYAVIYGDPNALLFRDGMYGDIRADICGDCGHVELRALHAERLYEHYLRSIE